MFINNSGILVTYTMQEKKKADMKQAFNLQQTLVSPSSKMEFNASFWSFPIILTSVFSGEEGKLEG